ncbi:MAG: SpoIID/LytB domain-containing protein [Actinobacteria bacterium]|nr:SpoIID/LytB domain-containing protein [Actinomycetota bacterium]
MPQEPMMTSRLTSPALRIRIPRQAASPTRLTLGGVFALLALLVMAGPAAALSTQYAFTITGHGWGHGVGMSQWGAYGYAKHGWDYKDILKHYYTGISLSTVENSVIRVNLRSGQSAIKLSCPNAYTVQGSGATWTIPGGTTATTTHTSSGYRVVAGSLRRTFTAAPHFKPTKGALRLITKTDLGDDGAYRGTIKVVYKGGLMMINHVPLESYLRGVVPHEVSPSWPREAVKAQACAARAFALGSKQPSKSWDVYCDVRDQAYMGVGIEDSRTDAAVRETAGVCPTFNGKPIVATYFSCSGGHTESAQHVWGGSYAYLKGVEDPYDYYGTLHDWGPLRRTPAQIGGRLGASGSLRAVYTVKRGVSPRIVKAAVIGSKGTTYIDGGSLRVKLGLNSAWAVFTSMGISPAARDGVSIKAGSKIVLKGRLYPALADGATVKLHFYYDGRWRSRKVTTVRKAEKLPGGHTARYSLYTESVSPKQTTKYYFSSGKAKSPVTTITVK